MPILWNPELGVSVTSNGSAKSEDMVEIAATATPPPSSEDDDYEDLDYGSRKKTEPVTVPQEQAKVAEEVVAVEPIYTMVVKSPRIVQAFDQEPTDQPVNGVDHSEAEREAGDGQQAGESPVPWEYKLPARSSPRLNLAVVLLVPCRWTACRRTLKRRPLFPKRAWCFKVVLIFSKRAWLRRCCPNQQKRIKKYLYYPAIRGINSTDWNQRRMSFIRNQLHHPCLHCRPHLRLLKVTKTTMFTRPIFHWILICAFPSPPTTGVLQRILLTTRSCRAPIRRT